MIKLFKNKKVTEATFFSELFCASAFPNVYEENLAGEYIFFTVYPK
jgi:hypothetical protein